MGPQNKQVVKRLSSHQLNNYKQGTETIHQFRPFCPNVKRLSSSRGLKMRNYNFWRLLTVLFSESPLLEVPLYSTTFIASSTTKVRSGTLFGMLMTPYLFYLPLHESSYHGEDITEGLATASRGTHTDITWSRTPWSRE